MTPKKWEIVDRLAGHLGVSENTRRVWRQRQVPHKWRLPLLRLAQETGDDLTVDDLDGTPRRATPGRRRGDREAKVA